MPDLKSLPKVSLHDHLDGGLRAQTIIDLAAAKGIELPTQDVQELAEWFLTSCSGGDLKQYLKTFELTVAVMQSREELERVAYEFALDLAEDGVVYAEVRWAPSQHLRAGLSMQGAVDAVREGFRRAVTQLQGEGVFLRVQQILCAMRHENNSIEVAELALKNRDRGVCSFDLAGPEDGFLPEKHAVALKMLADNFFPVTIHAGEEGTLESIASALQNGALRLGHGTRLTEDFIFATDEEDTQTLLGFGSVAEWVRNRQITIESCPSSNLQTRSSLWGPTIADHPFDAFYRLGFLVTVNTDNRLMSAVTLTSELELLATTFGYGVKDLAQFQLNAAQSAFLSLENRTELGQLIEDWLSSQNAG